MSGHPMQTIPILKFLTLLFFLITSVFSVQAIEPQPFTYPWKVEVFDLPVSSNGIQYRLYIRPPIQSVEAGKPVHSYYFLDALTNFTPAAAMSFNYEQFGYMPSGYFIGIGYTNESDGEPKATNRTRDYTPTQFTPDTKHFLYAKKQDWQGSGGAPAFTQIIKQQIIPFVEQQYAINGGQRTLIGKSLSGLAASYIALTQPDLFNQYVIISPSIWWDDWLLKREQRAISQIATTSASTAYTKTTSIYLAVGDDEERMGMVTDVHVLANQLVMQKRKNLKVAVDVLPAMNHEGAFPEGFMRGIVGVFQGADVKAHPVDKQLSWR
jgi:uncharacterized protein